MIENVERKIIEFLKDKEIPTKEDYRTLMNRIDTLSKKLDDLSVEEATDQGNAKEN
jgi:polyhydroxyalkanoate synthesis regulator phasin